MERIPIDSKAIVSAGWVKDTLEVEFPNGDVYQYSPVSEKQYQDMLSAPSVGSYFMRNIRAHVRGVRA